MAHTSLKSYIVGQTIELRGRIYDTVNQTAIDPTTVACRVKKGNGVVQSVAVERLGVGLYRALVTTDVHGWWTYRFEGLGVIQSVDEGKFFVDKSAI